MSTEYYTIPPVPFEEAKAKLEANANGLTFVDRPGKFYPEAQAHTIHKEGVGVVWLRRETREPIEGVLLPPIGSAIFEIFAGNYSWLPELIPWIETILGVQVINEVGLDWRIDVGDPVP